MKICLLYFETCPSYQPALDNLKTVLVEEGLTTPVEMVPVTSPEEARRLNFLGSPTIQIDGVDLEGADAVKAGIGYGCRVYQDGQHLRGWPSKERIRSGLNQLLKK